MPSLRATATLLAAWGLLAAPLASRPHPDSWSRSLLVVEDATLTVFLRVQTVSLQEVLTLDGDGDRFVSAQELAAAHDEVLAYLDGHFRVSLPGGAPLLREDAALRLVTEDQDALAFAQYVDCERRYRLARPPVALAVEMTLFLETSPLHTDACAVQWPGGDRQDVRLWAGRMRAELRPAQPPPRPSAWDELLLGVEHILGGYDHLAFLAALLVACGSLRSLVAVVTAFTLAHSVTLSLAALEVVSVPARPVEVLIAASIAAVGLANLLGRGRRPVWTEAFVFGLLHGLGFASVLAEYLTPEAGRLRLLLLFNVGIEVGQLALVAAVLLGLAAVRRTSRRARAAAPPRPPLPSRVRPAVSSAVLLLGVGWTIERLLS